MHYHQIIILVVCCLIALGVYCLPGMKKNEFPDFTIRQGIVVAVAPGLSADEMVEQVTKPLEDYIFTYKEVRKDKTISKTRDGIVYIQVQLNDDLNNKDEFWSKFKHGVSVFKSELPANVLALRVMDDFGDTSALLITMESDDKTYRELSDYMDDLQEQLRRISSVGRMTVSGVLGEQISVYVDDSVTNFLHELVIAVVAVIIVVMLLLPLRVALIAASTIPITIFISLGMFSMFGIELNTVTLAALIVTLGMIVDNSIVIIDNYLEQIGEGVSRWHASIESTTHFFNSIFSATLAISITFFPFLLTTTGLIKDFVNSFPWAVTLVLFISLLVATLLVPFMQFFFIRKPMKRPSGDRKSFSFLDMLQTYYR